MYDGLLWISLQDFIDTFSEIHANVVINPSNGPGEIPIAWIPPRRFPVNQNYSAVVTQKDILGQEVSEEDPGIAKMNVAIVLTSGG